ncbi:hypothetical protein KFL_003550060 [Klebsormidium nitens]|uniref:UDENN domain-containing protein n=1 Tax=Klebsormidium nitens TaxID=105231 RepID=A0A1Y1IFG1_KLENI|nr:hypothetical protein KFL_003550060 [Klebsormidium nitens]|eukprot:GAQ87467.1 hypothetical protein KFL_003550060 [Klebsormidium nitens]
MFTYFFTASADGLGQGPVTPAAIYTSNRFCPHQPHIAALSSLSASGLQCRCGQVFKDAGAFAILPPGDPLMVDQVHSFALTASDGARTYGFCRHIAPFGGDLKGPVQPTVACILSSHYWPSVFQEVLTVLEALLSTPLDSTAPQTGPSEWLAPHSPASQFLEALLETRLPPPGDLFSVRRVISKQQVDHPPPEQGLSPLHLLDASPVNVLGLEGGGIAWADRLKSTPPDESPSGVLDAFDANNPFDPPLYDTDVSPPQTRPDTPALSSPDSQPPPPDQAPDDPPASPSNDSSFSSFSSLGFISPEVPHLEGATSPPRRDAAENGASEPSVSGRLEGWELVYSFERPWDVEGDPLADASLEPLLRLVPPQVLVALLAALLRERRIAIVGPSPGDVSGAVFALAAILHPFQWQHIFLPTLPEAFLHYLSAPMPFLVGVQSATWQKLQSEDISLGDIVVLDLGLGSLFSSFPDRKELPKDPASSLETNLRAAYSHLSPPAARDAFLRFFLSLFGWYRRFVRFDGGGHVARPDSPFGGPSATCHLWFDHRTFVESVRDKKTAAFLNGFQGSQMYEAFVREVLARAARCASGEDPFSTEVRRLYDQSS